MKSLILSIFIIGSITAVEATILCGDKDPIVGKRCFGLEPKINLTQMELSEIKKIKSAIDNYFDNSCVNDGMGCVKSDSLWIEYCDTTLKTCSAFGDSIEDSGIFSVFRVIYTDKEDKIKIKNVKRTSDFSYPN